MIRLQFSDTAQEFTEFNQVEITSKYDSLVSSFAFMVNVNSGNPDHQQLLKPAINRVAKIYDDNQLLLTGYTINQTFKASAVEQLMPLSGYSLPGILQDSNIANFPLQYNNLNLSEIADRLLKPYGIEYEINPLVRAEVSKKYTKITAKDSQTVKAYLAELATQRGVLLSHTPEGKVLFTRLATSTAVAHLYEGDAISTNIELSFSGQQMHSSIKVVGEQSLAGGNAKQAEVNNPYVNIYKPKVVRQSSGDDNDTEKIAKMALASELKNIKLTIALSQWQVNGSILKPGQLIEVTIEKPRVDKASFLIEEVKLQANEKKQTATLSCVLPEVYTLETPTNIFT